MGGPEGLSNLWAYSRSMGYHGVVLGLRAGVEECGGSQPKASFVQRPLGFDPEGLLGVQI